MSSLTAVLLVACLDTSESLAALLLPPFSTSSLPLPAAVDAVDVAAAASVLADDAMVVGE